MYRTHISSGVNEKISGDKVVLAGWVHRRRDHGGVVFVDLRDRYGLVQIVSDPESFADTHKLMDSLRSEFVIKVEGTVRNRPEGQENPKMQSGRIEVVAEKIEILNESLTPPFEIDQDKEVGEEIRLKYRYLDLRRERLRDNIVLRHEVIKFIRDYFDENGFVEIETPVLIKGTPEGSREYIVPSRIYPGTFFVLPQSPQQLKQLLMVAGFEKYFQIVRCFRDEDLRGDRQPEFTQLDLEMSFVDAEDVMAINEKVLIGIAQKFAADKKMKETPFPVFSYKEAMERFGSDKPDLRFDLELSDVSDIAAECGFEVFRKVVDGGGVVKVLNVPAGAKFSRKDISELEEVAKIYGAKGLAYIVVEDELKSPILKFFKDEEVKAILDKAGAKKGDIVFFGAADFKTACESLGAVRLEVAKKLELIDENLLAFCWINDFPMFEVDEETGKLNAVHHPFTAPKDPVIFKENPAEALAIAYDVVLNGSEVGGGSIRIHKEDIQANVFDVLEISKQDAEKRFGHMLEAFKYGAPPHGGIAWGLDRLVMILAGEPNIREVIAFPKDQKAKDVMLGSPSEMPAEQLAELRIKIDEIE